MDEESVRPGGHGTARLPSKSLGSLAAVAAAVAGEGALVFAPLREGKTWTWRACDPAAAPGAELWAEFVNTDVSPREILLPRTEDVVLWHGRYSGLRLEEPRAPGPAVVFGLRPCDAAALELLDEVLIAGPHADEAYRLRRQKTLLVVWACGRTGPACFCDAFGPGLGPASAAGDVTIFPDGQELLLLAVTERGAQVLEALRRMGSGTGAEPVDAAAVASRAAALAAQRTRLGARLDLRPLEREPGALTPKLFASGVWADLAPRCLSCGACTYVCPTCYCFAVNDEPRGSDGRRVRTWDSCQFKDFLTMAGGHNPRPSKLERVRQRFLHKLSYHRDRYSKFLCVGCGRCVLACPVGLHMGQVAEALAQEAAREAGMEAK